MDALGYTILVVWIAQNILSIAIFCDTPLERTRTLLGWYFLGELGYILFFIPAYSICWKLGSDLLAVGYYIGIPVFLFCFQIVTVLYDVHCRERDKRKEKKIEDSVVCAQEKLQEQVKERAVGHS